MGLIWDGGLNRGFMVTYVEWSHKTQSIIHVFQLPPCAPHEMTTIACLFLSYSVNVAHQKPTKDKGERKPLAVVTIPPKTRASWGNLETTPYFKMVVKIFPLYLCQLVLFASIADLQNEKTFYLEETHWWSYGSGNLLSTTSLLILKFVFLEIDDIYSSKLWHPIGILVFLQIAWYSLTNGNHLR